MTKTILINGYGPGISHAIAQKFGEQGFAVALVARNAQRLNEGAGKLEAAGIRAAAFPADLADPAAIKTLVKSVNEKLGTISVVQWNAYAGGAGDVLATDATEIRGVLDVAVTGLIAIAQETLADLRGNRGALLVTNGGLGALDPGVDAAAVQWNVMGLAVANAAKHKLVRLLAAKLKNEGVYVGEVMVLASVKGTPWDNGSATLEASTVATKFWEIYQARSETSVQVG